MIMGTREAQEAEFFRDLESTESARREEAQVLLHLQPTAETRQNQVIVFPGNKKGGQ